VYGGDRLTVSVFLEGAPLVMANVCVSQIAAGGAVTYFPLSEASPGHYTFDTAGAADGDLIVVVTGDNVIPHVARVHKVSVPSSPRKARGDGFVNDVTVAGSSIIAARGDGKLTRYNGDLNAPSTVTVSGDGKPLLDLATFADGSVAVAVGDAAGQNVAIVSPPGAVTRSWALSQHVNRVVATAPATPCTPRPTTPASRRCRGRAARRSGRC